ncbi:tyrosine-protein phosphatase [Schumannella soli]|uniref:tyrosine-protein phosphatase n=1 Tax=Schumannella soli TaxID=2590779 RepID=UPI0015E84A54|nr:tyrosine-protein phosphatase [Schumannella soli]
MTSLRPLTPRDVDWEGLPNARDLGGIPLEAGTTTAAGRLFRSGRPDGMTAAGWSELVAAGVRRVVDLRNERERELSGAIPDAVEVVWTPIEDDEDLEFLAEWRAHLGSPRYYATAVRRWPLLLAAALRAIAGSPADAGVLVHCLAGRDRTGLVVALLLQAAGAPLDAIVDDYAAAARGIRAHFATLPSPPEPPLDDAAFESALRENAATLREFLTTVDVPAILTAAGAEPDLLARAAARLRA